MYTPKHFKQDDQKELIRFMNQFNFALLICDVNGKPVATHLPFVIEERDEKIILVSHMAVANNQWKHFSNKEVLVIFSEPHAYISPSFYEKKENVPTWNYASVHVYGKATLIEESEKVLLLLEKQIKTFDANYFEQWKDLSIEYKLKMMNGIKAFEITVAELQGTYKLSQNKTKKEKENIIHAFENSADENQNIIAEMMKKQK